jgi:hypothetical protein
MIYCATHALHLYTMQRHIEQLYTNLDELCTTDIYKQLDNIDKLVILRNPTTQCPCALKKKDEHGNPRICFNTTKQCLVDQHQNISFICNVRSHARKVAENMHYPIVMLVPNYRDYFTTISENNYANFVVKGYIGNASQFEPKAIAMNGNSRTQVQTLNTMLSEIDNAREVIQMAERETVAEISNLQSVLRMHRMDNERLSRRTLHLKRSVNQLSRGMIMQLSWKVAFNPASDVCPCCFEPMNANDSGELRCNHAFHTKCLEKWFRTSRQYSCPMCRGDVNMLDYHLFPDETSQRER